MMDEKKFWSMIAESRKVAVAKGLSGDEILEDQIELLTEQLRALSPATIVEFNDRFYALHASAYRWDLWGAAYWLGGGCSDDGFTDFRATLISLGEERFNRVLKDPDSLAEIVDQKDVPFLQSEGFQYAAFKAYKSKTNEQIPFGERREPKEPVGEGWDFDDHDETSEHLPRLVERFPEMGD